MPELKVPGTLEEILQRLYDSEINVTITMLWDGGFQVALISYMEWPDTPASPGPPINAGFEGWTDLEKVSEIAKALHNLAIQKYPNSSYVRCYGHGGIVL